MKHTLIRKNHRRKYQIKTKRSKKLRSNKGRRMVGGYGAEFTQYILLQVNALIANRNFKDMSQDDDTIYHIVRNIASGGSFTNKMNGDGNGVFRPGVNLEKLLQSASIFYNWTKGLNENKFNRHFTPVDQAAILGEQVTLYRHVRISPANAVRNMIQPIPMSCTWDIDFAIGWMQSHGCCICEMTIPSTDVFLPLSMPPPAPAGVSPIPLNQSQYEVTVAPCILTYTNTRMHTDGITTIYTYDAKTCADLAEVTRNFNQVRQYGCFF